MTDPTPTRDEAVLRYYADTFCELGSHHECCGKLNKDECSGCLARSALASAPAPASVGVDAGRVTLFSALEAAYIRGAAWCAEMGMTHTFSELRKAAYDYADKEEKDVICREVRASLSPAATPVSEAEPTGLIAKLRVGALHRDVPEWISRVMLEASEALAKPAPSPAGGDVVREALVAYHDAYSDRRHAPEGSHEAYDAAARLEDAHDLATRALSQSTSAGRAE